MRCGCHLRRKSIEDCDNCQYQLERQRQFTVSAYNSHSKVWQKKTTPKRKPTARLLPCIHRGEYVGVLDCSCDGGRETYRCTKLVRPNYPSEHAFCIPVLTSKAYSKIVDPTTKLSIQQVDNGEVVLCKPLHRIKIAGREQEIGCPSYEPASLETPENPRFFKF